MGHFVFFFLSVNFENTLKVSLWKKKENPIGQVIKGSLLHSQEPRGLLSSDDLSKFEIISTTWWIVIHRLDDVGKATYLFSRK